MKTRLLHLAVALTVAACVGCSSPNSPASPTESTTKWVVTQRFGSVTGPDNCWVNEQRARWSPAVFAGLPMTVTRTPSSVTVKGDFFQVNFTGTITGSEFSAVGDHTLPPSGGVCEDGQGPFTQLTGASKLTGRFSSDTNMTASEVNTYPLAGGGTVTYTWEWQATRVN